MICPECGSKLNSEKCEKCGCDKINICLNCLKTFKDSDDFCSDCNLHTISLKDYLKIKEDLDFANRLFERKKLGAVYAYEELLDVIPQAEFLFYRCALYYYFYEDDEEAIKYYNKVLKLNPIHPESNAQKALIIDKWGDEEGLKFIDMAIGNIVPNSDSFGIYSTKFLILLNSYSLNEANEFLNVLEEKFPDKDLTPFKKDLVKVTKKKEKSIQKPLSKIRENDLIEIPKEDLEELKSNFKDMDDFYLKLKQLLSKSIDEDSIDALNCKANIFLDFHENDCAVDFIDKALEIDDSDAEALSLKALVYARMDDFEKADSYLDKVFKIDENNVQALNIELNKFLKSGDFDEAINYADKVLAIDSENLDALANKAEAFYHKSEYEKALDIYKELQKKDPEESIFKLKMDACLVELGREDEININHLFEKEFIDSIVENMLLSSQDFEMLVQIYNDYLSREPNNLELICRKGLALAYDKKYDESLKCLDEGLKKNPKNPKLFRAKAILFLKQGKHKKALKFIDKSLKLDSEDIESLTNKGLILINMGRFKQAIKFMDKLLKEDDLEEEFYILKSMALLSLFEFDKVDEYVDLILKINPESSEGLTLKEELREIREELDM